MDDSSACEGCGREGATQVCPKCKELGLRRSLFCTQECFKANWKTHKVKHTTEAHIASIKTMTDEELRFFDFTGPLRPAKITPKRGVPMNIVRPDYADHPAGVSNIEEKDYRDKIVAHSTDVQQRMRRVCQLAREVLDIASLAVRPGVTTDELDRIVHEATIERGMYPSPLNYYRFPKSVCTSVNEVICHGIPDSRPLEEGDIVNLDVSCYYDGLHADLNETVFSGRPDEASVRLVHCAWNCLQKAIALCKPGTPYRNIGNVITEYAHARNCSVVRTYCGHGVSEKFHCAPNVPHYANNKAVGTMAAGNIFTIEPMINEGTWRDVRWPDQWTAATADGKRSAQFEETLLITKTGVEILTAKPNHGLPRYQEQLNEWCIELPSE